MRHLRIISVISILVLFLPITHSALGLTIEEQKACLAKLPKTATHAEKTVAKNKCSDEARSGKKLDMKTNLKQSQDIIEWKKCKGEFRDCWSLITGVPDSDYAKEKKIIEKYKKDQKLRKTN